MDADQSAAEGRVKKAKHRTKEMIFRWKEKAGEELDTRMAGDTRLLWTPGVQPKE